MTTANHTVMTDRAFKLMVSTSEGMHFFRPEEITRLEANSNYTYIHFTNRKPLLISKVLKIYDQLLKPMGFVRTHHSHLVNKIHISSIDPKGGIIMQDDSRVEVSRAKRKKVMNEVKIFYMM